MASVAIVDMYGGTPNLGLAAITDLVKESGVSEYQSYDVRVIGHVPDLSYDIYIFSGGPGDPREVDSSWGDPFFQLIDNLWTYNTEHPDRQKHVLLVCHSFQMACSHFGLGKITGRKSQSFGVFPVHLTADGRSDALLGQLPDPFYAADFRHYQLIQPNQARFDEMGAAILALEKIRAHVPLERAIMAVRFSEAWLGVQFHPEADPAGMRDHFYKKTVREKAVEIKGKMKFARMLEDLDDPTKLEVTYRHVIPGFLSNAIAKTMEFKAAIVS